MFTNYTPALRAGIHLKYIPYCSQSRARKQGLTESYTVLNTAHTDKSRLRLKEVYSLEGSVTCDHNFTGISLIYSRGIYEKGEHNRGDESGRQAVGESFLKMLSELNHIRKEEEHI